MTQDEIIRMAREAGFINLALEPKITRFAALIAQNYMAKACGGCVIKKCYKQMDAEIEAAVIAEREACAKACEQLGALNTATPKKIAAAIRARGEK